LSRYVLFPVFELFKLQNGLSYEQASIIIGSHFTDVKDTLTNFLQLSSATNSNESSELLLASISQKANGLKIIPFSNAINFKSNVKYLPLAVIPVVLLFVFFLSGNQSIIADSYNRVVHFNTVFIPPAPFEFIVLNNSLQTEENKDFIIKVKTLGAIVPENAMIFIDDESYFLESTALGEFKFKIANPNHSISFHFEANKVYSKVYKLNVLQVPTISDFEMTVDFPSYLSRKSEVIKGTGNAIIPEGSRISWKVTTQATDAVLWFSVDKNLKFIKVENEFVFNKNIFQNADYQVITSNLSVSNHERLNYKIAVIKDQFPSIDVSALPDSLRASKPYLVGRVSDDYGISKLQIVYYKKGNTNVVKRGTIAVKGGNVDQFIYSFPGNLQVDQGVEYEFYFEVFDNDALHNYKSSRSTVFGNRILTDSEKRDEVLQQQSDNIKGLEKSLWKQNKQIVDLDKLQKLGKEKDKFEFKDQQLVKDFIERQQKQYEMMKQFTDNMKQNLDKTDKAKSDDFKEALEKRLENATKELNENDKLLEELKQLNDKIKNEDLLEKVDNFKQQSKNQIKNLKQLVELTKKYYVEKKAAQIADKLDKLSEKQDKLAESKGDDKAAQQAEVAKDFAQIKEELKELKLDNEKLATPLDVPDSSAKAKDIDEDVKSALEELKKTNKQLAKPKQKNAAKNMKSLAASISKSVDASKEDQLKEDVKMLRQILDNLVAFSLAQEELMGQFKVANPGSSIINKKIKWQQDLKLQFKHVDDSLYTLALRNPRIAEDVTVQVGNMQYNIDKALDNFSEVQFAKGISHQQYTIAAANKLGDFLSNYLNDMQMSMSGSGQGQPKPGDGEGMQLPDIIKKQDGLADKLKKGKDGKKESDSREGGKNQKEGDGTDGEGDAKAIMDIYKEQQRLREALENELKKQGLSGQGRNALEQMKQIEKQLLNKGFNNQVVQSMLNLKRELLKLDTAVKEQGEDNKRESEGSKKQFSNSAAVLPKSVLDYFNSVEILNRQSLPLRSDFNVKIREYFNRK
jgi:hypothetical protein